MRLNWPCPFWGIARGRQFLHTSRTMSSRATRGTPAVARASRLGDRLRQLRIAAGLTQSELARNRFSKEYISQIERGKTRPTSETVDWLAAALGVDPAFLASGVSSDERARAEAMLSRAEALVEKREYDSAVDEYAQALGAVVATGAVELRVRLLSGEAWARLLNGEVRSALELLNRGARPCRRARVQRSRPGRGAVPPRRGALSDLEPRDLDRTVRRGAHAHRPVRASVRSAPRKRSHLALALLSAPARLRGCARGRRARTRARRVDERRARSRRRVLPGLARRRARRPLGACAHLRRACEGAVRGALRPHERRAAAEQPRRPRLHCSGIPRRRSPAFRRRSRSRSSTATTTMWRRLSRRLPRCI